MVLVWFMDNDTETDQRMEHHRNPPEYLDTKQLYEKTGVEYFQFDGVEEEKFQALRKDRGYSYEDEISISKDTLPDYDNKLKMFFSEHLHTDEEIRYVLEGSGYFDVRDGEENWIRIKVNQGDLIIIPSGIYHRFTLDMKNYIKAKRYFIGEPVWLPYNRPADSMECRQLYVQKLREGFQPVGLS